MKQMVGLDRNSNLSFISKLVGNEFNIHVLCLNSNVRWFGQSHVRDILEKLDLGWNGKQKDQRALFCFILETKLVTNVVQD